MSEKAWLITGATRGLGLALARWAADAGYRIYGCGSKAETVAAARAVLGSAHSLEQVDVGDADAVERWLQGIFSGPGPYPDCIINNAAIITPNAPLWEVASEDFARLVNINICGSFHVMKSAIPHLRQHGGGVIVNLSSGWGRSVSPEVAPYCASKWAIEGLTQALAQELPDTIAAYALNPGVIDTDMLRSTFGAGAASSIKPDAWAKKAGPRIEKLSRQQGQVSVSV